MQKNNINLQEEVSFELLIFPYHISDKGVILVFKPYQMLYIIFSRTYII